MNEFQGFPPGKLELIKIPEQFYTEGLQLFDNIDEIKLIRYIVKIGGADDLERFCHIIPLVFSYMCYSCEAVCPTKRNPLFRQVLLRRSRSVT